MIAPNRSSGRLAVALSIAAAFVPRATEAQSRLIVLPFRGARAEEVRADVIEAVQGIPGVQLVPEAQLHNAASALGLRPSRLTETDRAALARQLRLDAMVAGRITRKRRRRRKEWLLTVTVYDAQGASVGSTHWRGRSFATLRAVRRNGTRRIGRLVSKAAERSRSSVASASSNTTWWRGSSPPDPASGSPPGPAPPPVEPTPEPPSEGADEALRTRGTPAFTVSLQGGLLARSLDTEVRVVRCIRDRSCDGSDPLAGDTFREPRSYESAGAGHAEVGFSFVLYPGAIEATQPLPWLGVYGGFSHSVGLRTSGPACQDAPECPATTLVDVPTSQLEMHAGARLRALPTLGERRARLEADIGWGRLQFDFETSALAQLDRSYIVPPFDYQWVEFGARAGIELIPRRLELNAEGALRLPYTPGQQARAIWGRSASVSGWNAGLSLHADLSFLASGLFAELHASWSAFASTFSGQPACFRQPCTESVYDLWEPWPERNGRTEGFDGPVSDAYRRLALRIGWQWTPAPSASPEGEEGTPPTGPVPWPPPATPANPAPWPPPAPTSTPATAWPPAR